MTAFKSEFLHTLSERGFIHQCSDPEGLDKLFSSETVTAYVGYDCTAPSVHVGNLVSMMILHWMQKTGHRPIALMGGGTTMVGDPSGRDETRQLLTPEKTMPAGCSNSTMSNSCATSAPAFRSTRCWPAIPFACALNVNRP
jgi:tyrosyl-tRNA synthetase